MTHPGKVEIELVNTTVSRFFEALSFEKGTQPNIEKISDLFVTGGLLINCNEESPKAFTVVQFIEHFKGLYGQGEITSLHEREVHHKTKVYEHIAHRYSFYEARNSPEEEPFAVGINSIQLVKIGADWKIASFTWNDDKGDGFFQRTMACVQTNS